MIKLIMNYLIILIFILSCNSNDSENRKSSTNPELIEVLSDDRFVGQWKLNNVEVFNSKLILRKDGSFKYYDNQSFFRGFSKGVYTTFGDGIILNSSRPDTCLIEYRFRQRCPPIQRDSLLKTTIPGCTENLEAPIYFVFFINDTLILEDDLLHPLYKHTCTNIMEFFKKE